MLSTLSQWVDGGLVNLASTIRMVDTGQNASQKNIKRVKLMYINCFPMNMWN